MADSVRAVVPHVPTYVSASDFPRLPATSLVDAPVADGDVEVHRRLAMSEPSDRASAPRPRSRSIFDPASGARWCVVETDARATPGALAPRCLLFFSAGAVRRVWSYPEGWEALPDAALLRLSEAPVSRAMPASRGD